MCGTPQVDQRYPVEAQGGEPEPSPESGDPPGSTRPARADARRNREKLLDAARAAFTGADTAVPLETVARAAGVGIGTLYRHFPTREALVEAVYAAELDDVTRSPATLLADHAPDIALRVWMDRYARFVATKRGLVGVLRAGGSTGSITTPATRERITAAIGTLLAAGARAGSLRADTDPADITALLLGVFLGTAADDTPGRTGRLLDLVVAALRPAAPGANKP
ncbi:MAG: TetR/AcrR family transcriptional regulator [Nocardia sp.]|nr:TetR/AcrR family transcriptional regulator [Nocardia sp.]